MTDGKASIGASLHGVITFDLTEHRKNMPRLTNGHAGRSRRRATQTGRLPRRVRQKKHLDVTFDLVLIIESKNLMYEASWPSRSQAAELGDVVPVTKTGYVSLAPYLAFGAE
jgi:hypothetical protein